MRLPDHYFPSFSKVPSCEGNRLPTLEVAAPSFIPLPGHRMVEGMSNAAYHAHPSLSHSLMRYLEPATAPVQFWHRSWLNPDRTTDDLVSTGINTGNLLHDALEDFEAFKAKISSNVIELLPGVKFTKKRGKCGAARGGQLDAVLNLRAKLMQIPMVREIMEDGLAEVSLFSEYPLEPYLADMWGAESLTLRCRPDLRGKSRKVTLHWKSVGRMDPWCLGMQIDRLRYIEGIAHYRHVERLQGCETTHIIVFLEVHPPYEIRMIQPSDDRLDECQPYGERAVHRFIELYSEFGEGRWPDFSATPQNIYPLGQGGVDTINLPHAYDRRLAA